MNFTVDRIEGEVLILVTPESEIIEMDRNLCKEAKEGDVLSIEVVKEDTSKKKAEMERKLSFLKDRNI